MNSGWALNNLDINTLQENLKHNFCCKPLLSPFQKPFYCPHKMQHKKMKGISKDFIKLIQDLFIGRLTAWMINIIKFAHYKMHSIYLLEY